MTLYNKKSYLLLVAFVIIILPQIFYGDGRILMAGDYAWPLDFARFFELVWSTWDDSYAFGNSAPRQHASLLFSSFGYLLTQFDFSHMAIQTIFFSLSVLICLSGTVQLGRIFGWDEEQNIVFSLLYIFSSISLHYWAPDHGLNIFAYCLLPATISLALKFLITRNFFILAAFFLISANPSFSNPTFFIVYGGFLVFTLIISGHILNVEEKVNLNSSSKILLIFIFIFANLYWLLPFLVDIRQAYHGASNETAGLISDYKIAVQDSSTLLYSILGNGGGFWTANAFHAPGEPIRLWGEYIRSNLFIFFNVSVLIISLFPLFTNKVDKKHVIFLCLYVSIIVFISGLKYSFPINLIPDLFLDIPGFERGFRSMFMKFGLVLAFLASIIMSYSVKTKFKVITYFFILLSIVPFLKGVNYSDNNGNRPGEYMIPPAEYNILTEISQGSNSDFPPSMVLLPFNDKSYNIKLKWGEEGYVGAEFLRMYWHGPVLNFNDNSFGSNQIIEYCVDSVSIECVRYLLSNGNSFFLVRNDSYSDLSEISYVRNKLLDIEELGLLKTAEKNEYFHLFESTNVIDSSAHFLSIECHGSKDLAFGRRINGSLISIHTECKSPIIEKYGNHNNDWWICDGGEYQTNVSNNRNVKEQKIDEKYIYVFDFGCGIAYKTLEILLPSLIKKSNFRYIVYPSYISFILGFLISIFVLLLVSLTGLVQILKNKVQI
jgi:hypothetical protein